MDVVVAGGGGQVGRRLVGLLAREGHRARGLVRRPEQADELGELGGEGALFDLEASGSQALAEVVRGADAVVFAAGAGAGSGPQRKRTVDLGGAVLLIEAAQAAGVERYVMGSSIGAHAPQDSPEPMRPYHQAKAEADAALAASGLRWTIVRPGRLTDDPGTGRVRVSTHLGERADVPRDDVAAVLAACLVHDAAVGVTFELFAGDLAVDEAVAGLAPA